MRFDCLKDETEAAFPHLPPLKLGMVHDINKLELVFLRFESEKSRRVRRSSVSMRFMAKANITAKRKKKTKTEKLIKKGKRCWGRRSELTRLSSLSLVPSDNSKSCQRFSPPSNVKQRSAHNSSLMALVCQAAHKQSLCIYINRHVKQNNKKKKEKAASQEK
jgi:hypothetical protein